jgi:hypothetical protein
VNLGHWQSNLQIDESNIPFGFIYLITNTVSGKKYIGKKQMKSVLKREPLKGKKNKRHFDIETDWREYTSSSNDLNEDIQKIGKDKFTFEIIKLCDSKFDLAFSEAKLQFENDVLLRDDFYNGIINCRIGKAPRLFVEKYYNKKSCNTSSQNMV